MSPWPYCLLVQEYQMENFTFTLARFYVLITFSSRSYSWWWEALTGAAKPLRGWLAFSHYKQNPRSKNRSKKIRGWQKKLLEGRLFIGRGDRVHLLDLTIWEMTSISMVFPRLGHQLVGRGTWLGFSKLGFYTTRTHSLANTVQNLFSGREEVGQGGQGDRW